MGNESGEATVLPKQQQSPQKEGRRSFKISKKNLPIKAQPTSISQLHELPIKITSITRQNSLLKKEATSRMKCYDFLSYQGNREYNEDRILIKEAVKIGVQQFLLLAVFDGHGGSAAAEFLKMYFVQILQNCAAKFQHVPKGPKISYVLREAVLEIEKKIISNGTKIISGSCGTFMLICEETRCYYAANVGDSRILIIDEKGEVNQLTDDHKPESLKEKERIIGSGGELYRSSFIHPETSEKIYGPWRTLPGKLSVSRTFGDYLAKKARKGVIIAEPDLFEGCLPGNSTVLLMSDGAYEKFENFQFSHFFSSEHSLRKQLSEFFRAIVKRNTNDNVSLIVLKTPPLSPSRIESQPSPSRIENKFSLTLTACSENDGDGSLRTKTE